MPVLQGQGAHFKNCWPRAQIWVTRRTNRYRDLESPLLRRACSGCTKASAAHWRAGVYKWYQRFEPGAVGVDWGKSRLRGRDSRWGGLPVEAAEQGGEWRFAGITDLWSGGRVQLWMYLLGAHKVFHFKCCWRHISSNPYPCFLPPPSAVLVLLIHPFTLTIWPLMALEQKAPCYIGWISSGWILN